jgi:hypothetical protein
MGRHLPYLPQGYLSAPSDLCLLWASPCEAVGYRTCLLSWVADAAEFLSEVVEFRSSRGLHVDSFP